MNTTIEIVDNNTIETGTYHIWYRDAENKKQKRELDENHVNALLDMRQKEQFFMGKYKFKIGLYDFKTIILNGERRKGL